VGQPLLGLAYPTTPDIGLTNLPIMCGACKESVIGHHGGDGGGREGMHNGGGILGGAATAAQHALLAAGPHMVRGGLALLTPPDDNGTLDWQQDGIQRMQADREATVRMMTGITSQAREPAATEQVKVSPHDSTERSGTEIDSGLLPDDSHAVGPTIKPEHEAFGDDAAAFTDGDWIGSAMETLGSFQLFSSLQTLLTISSWICISCLHGNRSCTGIILHSALSTARCARSR